MSKEFNFADAVNKELALIGDMLKEKNIKYGNSALEPKRIFSKASPVEQILVRIDDKISRLANQNITDDEDVVRDLIGYLIILRIAQQKEIISIESIPSNTPDTPVSTNISNEDMLRDTTPTYIDDVNEPSISTIISAGTTLLDEVNELAIRENCAFKTAYEKILNRTSHRK